MPGERWRIAHHLNAAPPQLRCSQCKLMIRFDHLGRPSPLSLAFFSFLNICLYDILIISVGVCLWVAMCLESAAHNGWKRAVGFLQLEPQVVVRPWCVCWELDSVHLQGFTGSLAFSTVNSVFIFCFVFFWIVSLFLYSRREVVWYWKSEKTT